MFSFSIDCLCSYCCCSCCSCCRCSCTDFIFSVKARTLWIYSFVYMQIGNTANQLTNTRRKYGLPHGGLPLSHPLPLCYQWVTSLMFLTLIKPYGNKLNSVEQCRQHQTSFQTRWQRLLLMFSSRLYLLKMLKINIGFQLSDTRWAAR